MIESTLVSRPGSRIIAFLLLPLLFALGACSNQSDSPEQLIASAKQARDNGNYRSAIIHLKNALQSSPQNAEAHYLLGVSFIDIGDFNAAHIELSKALDLRYDLARVKIGRALLLQLEYQKVLDTVPLNENVDNAVKAEILTLRAMASIGVGRKPEGLALLEQALETQPDFADALLAQALLAEADGKPDDAATFIERALASTPKNVDAWLMKGDLSHRKGDTANALAAYQKVIDISAENVPARVKIATIQIESGKLDDARKQLEQVDKILPNLPRTKHLLALIQYHQKQYTAARDTVLQALRADPDYLPSVMLAGMVAYTLGDHAQAQARLGQIVERLPGYLYARKLLIASLAKTGNQQRAIEVLQPGLRQAPEDSALMLIAGELYLQNNELATAARYYEKAAKLDSKSAGARIGLGRSQLGLGQTDRALANLELAGELDPERYRADMLLVAWHLVRANYDEALRAMQLLEKKQPNNPLTYNMKAAIYLGKQDKAAARKNLEHALELDPKYVTAATNLAALDLDDKKPAAARRRLEAILEKDKDNAQALLALANIAPRVGATLKEQIGWLERARKASPDSVRPKLMLAHLYAQAGDPQKALEIARDAQRAHPDNPETLDVLGAIQMATGAKEAGLATYNKLVALRPKSAAALYRLAMAQAANADQRRAADTLRKAVSLQPDFVEAQLALAALELRAGRYPAAMKIAQQLQKQSAKSPAGYVLEGDVLMAEKKFQQAAKTYENAYGMGKSGMIVVKLHRALTRAGKPEEAQGHLTQWLKDVPDDAWVRNYAAEANLRTGNYQYAIEQYEWLSKKQPGNVMVLNNLANAYYQTKDARALETAERAYKLGPDDVAVADTLGWMLVEQGNTKRGIELLQKAVAAAPKATEPRYHLAKAFVKVGDRVQARQELQRLLTDAPNSRFAEEAKQLLEETRR